MPEKRLGHLRAMGSIFDTMHHLASTLAFPEQRTDLQGIAFGQGRRRRHDHLRLDNIGARNSRRGIGT